MGNCIARKVDAIKYKYTPDEIKDIQTLNQYYTGENMDAYICSVYDGDTCTAIIQMENIPIKISVRMNGYDCPEMKPSKNKKDRDNEIKFAKMGKEKLIYLVKDKRVKMNFGGLDKYGRLLGTIFVNNLNVNDYMLKCGYGYSYSGNTKADLEYFDDFYIMNGKKIVIKDDHMIQITV